MSGEAPLRTDADQRRRLTKIPTGAGNQVKLVDVEALLHLHSEGHYTRVVTAEDTRFCDLGVTDSEARLDPDQFMRVHRSVRLPAVKALLRKHGRLPIELGGDGEPLHGKRSASGEPPCQITAPPRVNSTYRFP